MYPELQATGPNWNTTQNCARAALPCSLPSALGVDLTHSLPPQRRVNMADSSRAQKLDLIFQHIRNVPDFPVKGIVFKWVNSVMCYHHVYKLVHYCVYSSYAKLSELI